MTLQSIASTPSAASLKPGFTDPVFDAQAVFRAAMLATAYPGRIMTLDRSFAAPKPFSSATAALCLTLMDFETPTWLDKQAAAGDAPAWLRFHCGLPLAEETATARFAVIADPAKMPRIFTFHPGDVEYPDRSSTLIIQVPSLTGGTATTWTGPGIKSSASAAIAGLPAWFWSDWDLNRELYPRGVDVMFTSGNAFIGLPRTITVEA